MKTPVGSFLGIAVVAAVVCSLALLEAVVSSGPNDATPSSAPRKYQRHLSSRFMTETHFWSSGTKLVIKGNNGSPGSAFPLGKCEGDCDSDDDCQSGLVCFQRDFNDIVPGCSGDVSNNNYDYCIHPSDTASSQNQDDDTLDTLAPTKSSTMAPTTAPTPSTASPTAPIIVNTTSTELAIMGNNGDPSNVFPLAVCQGDCDSDSDCEAGLVCFQRSGTETVPGCTWASDSFDGLDFCIDPSNTIDQANLPSLEIVSGHSGSLGMCQGDCNSNSDCQSGLFCYQRNAYESVPGCNGLDASGSDYCIDPHEMQSIPPQNTDNTNGGSSGDVFRMKLYWQQGYMWQGEDFERKWCMISILPIDSMHCAPRASERPLAAIMLELLAVIVASAAPYVCSWHFLPLASLQM